MRFQAVKFARAERIVIRYRRENHTIGNKPTDQLHYVR